MKDYRASCLLLMCVLFFSSGCPAKPSRQQALTQQDSSSQSELAPAYHTASAVKQSKVIGWPAGKTPVAPAGFRVTRYASLESPRWLYPLPNGDILVSQARKSWVGPSRSPDQITLLRGLKADGSAAHSSALIDRGLNLPFGMLFLGNWLYIADSEKVLRYPYQLGQTRVTAQPEQILKLPEGGYHGHWTRNIIASPDGQKLYIAVGSLSNAGEDGMEKEKRRAAILEINLDGTGERIFASGLRNPIGIAFYPETNILWAVVNERDGLGDDLVPDYLTRVQEGGFYGWPYSYFGQHEDPRRQGERPDLVAKAIVPDYNLGAHVAALGLMFYTGTAFPEHYQGGAFIGEHGSWNRSRFSGYKVAYIPFKKRMPSGPPEDFLTGFIANEERSEVYGRPVGVVMMRDGSILVADDAGDAIWRVAFTGQD